MRFAMRAALIQIRDKLKRYVDDEMDCYDLACNALATNVDAKYTEDEMQQMVADLADIELGAVRATTPGMAAEAIAQLLAGLVKPAAPVKFGCHCDKDPDVEADGCVIDTGDRADCVFASRNNNALKRKEDCEYWLPVKMVDASPTLPKTESNGTLVGCEDESGLLHIHPESELCAICRPQVASSATGAHDEILKFLKYDVLPCLESSRDAAFNRGATRVGDGLKTLIVRGNELLGKGVSMSSEHAREIDHVES